MKKSLKKKIIQPPLDRPSRALTGEFSKLRVSLPDRMPRRSGIGGECGRGGGAQAVHRFDIQLAGRRILE